jgi:hypothetical protein
MAKKRVLRLHTQEEEEEEEEDFNQQFVHTYNKSLEPELLT